MYYKTIKEVPLRYINRYRAGKYSFKTPPVYAGNWDELAWINYILTNGKFNKRLK